MGSEVEDIFLAEADRRLAEVESILQAGFPDPDSTGFTTLERHAHSLKGTAGSLGHQEIEALALDAWKRLHAELAGSAKQRIVRDFEEMRAELRRLQRTRQP